MSSRFIQLPLHPRFPLARVVALPRKFEMANPQPSQAVTQTELPAPDNLELMIAFGAPVGAESLNGKIEWLNLNVSTSPFERVDPQHVIACVIPHGPAQPPLAVLRFLIGEVAPYLLGMYEPAKKYKGLIPEASGKPGFGRKPRRTLTAGETLLHVLWDTPALERQLAHVLGIGEFSDAIYAQLLGGRVDRRTVSNYRKQYDQECDQARRCGYSEDDDE